PARRVDPNAYISVAAKPAPRRSLRWVYLAIAAFVIAGTATVAVVVASRKAPASGRTVVRIVVPRTASAGDAWLALAIEHIVTRDLRHHADRRFGLASTQQPATMNIEITHRETTPAGIVLEARRTGQSALLARGEGESVVAASGVLVSQLVASTNAPGASAVPDPDEILPMAKSGARSYEQFVRLRAVSERIRSSGYQDTSYAADEVRALLREDPTWPRAHYELVQTVVMDTDMTAAIAKARQSADRARDPDGVTLLEAYIALVEDREADAARLAGPVFARNDADLIAGEIMGQALMALERDDEARAVFRRLNERLPALYFAGELLTAFDREVENDRTLQLAQQIAAAHPENLSAMRELVRLQADRGDTAAADRDARRMVLIHGIDNPIAYADVFEALLASDDLPTARRVVDAMLLGTPLTRARGLYRAAVISVYEGRFDLARMRLREAIAAFKGVTEGHSESTQCLALLRDVAGIEGNRDALVDAVRGLAEWYASEPSAVAEYRYREQLALTGKCPDLDGALADVGADDQLIARRALVRVRAAAGCGPCADVVTAGVAYLDASNDGLLVVAKCALAGGDAHLAKRVAKTATVWSSWSSQGDASPLPALLAQYYLAEALARLGDTAGARSRYERFLRRWGNMPKPIPEIAMAKAALAKLGAP
ncbi:MAG TPA: hypothetical protein VIV11_15145, partial [Kofleriaceae bacterium]